MNKLINVCPSHGDSMRIVALAVLSDGKIDAYDGKNNRLDDDTSQSNVNKFIKIIGL